MPKVLKVWWSETYAKSGEKVTLNALTANAAHHALKFQIYEFRRKSKILKEISVPVHRQEVSAKWKVAYKPLTTEYGNPEFRFKAKADKSSKTSKTLYVPAELEIALTFDDGPAPEENHRTKRILDILKDFEIKAAFFVEHKNIRDKYQQELLAKMKKAGHEIGIHGVDPMKHHLPHQDTPDFENKLKAMRNLIEEIIGISPRYIRPPYGWGGWEKGRLWNKAQLRKIYQKFGLIKVDGWEAEIGKPDFWKDVERKIKAASEGNIQKLIILAHDLREYDAANLSKIIKGIFQKAKEVKVKISFVELKKIWE